MDSIKLGIQIATFVIGICIYGAIWKYFADRLSDMDDDDASPCIVGFYTVWFILHIIGITTAVIWAWM